MIFETIITTQNKQGLTHVAPMGIHVENNAIFILPFKPSTTLDNFLATGVGVINYCDDVRIFAGSLTGRKDWELVPSQKISGCRLANALAHTEVRLAGLEDDPSRPKLLCQTVLSANHAPFKGFNRAQYSVLEAAILVSRLHLLPTDKIQSELEYLRIGLEKTAGQREWEAWGWLMEAVETFNKKAAS